MNVKTVMMILAAGLVLPFLSPAAPAGEGRGPVVLGFPSAPTLRVGATNAWLSANSACPLVSAIQAEASTVKADFDGGAFGIGDVQAGFPASRENTEYWLGEKVESSYPFDVEATYDHWSKSEALQSQFVMDMDGSVYTVSGGTLTFDWISKGTARGSLVTNHETYTVASSSRTRPKRLFWTEPPFNSPAIDLSGKYARLFGSPNLVRVQTVPVTNTVFGQTMVTTQDVSGVRYDAARGSLSVVGTPRGQFVLVYYDTGNYDRILCAEVVEVCQPYVNVMKGEIGKPLVPHGDSWKSLGLTPVPTRQNETDYQGEYFYQHKGLTASCPKNGWVYPIRPTVGERWNMEVWWKEPDPMKVLWPFECDQYECDWPEDAPVFVRGSLEEPGKSITFPDRYTVTLMDYVDPIGHARLDDHAFTTFTAGWSLVRLEADDNVWFLPIRSVLRDDATWFTGERAPWEVAREIRPRGDAFAYDGVVSNRMETGGIAVDGTLPGYIYAPGTDGRYNRDVYPEAVFAVNAAQDGTTNRTIEVWWSQSWRGFPPADEEVAVKWLKAAEAMLRGDWSGLDEDEDEGDLLPVPVEIPSLVQRYAPVWPEPRAMREIVLASEKGSRSESVAYLNGAVQFQGPYSSVLLPSREYFNADESAGGTVMFWTRRGRTAEDLSGTPSAVADDGRNVLLSFKTMETEAGAYDWATVASLADGAIELTVASVSNIVVTTTNRTGIVYHSTVTTSIVERATFPTGDATGGSGLTNWLHVAVVGAGDDFKVYLNGTCRGTMRTWPAYGVLDDVVTAWMGGDMLLRNCTTGAGTEMGEISFWSRPLGDEEILDAAFTAFKGDEEGLSAYFSVSGEEDDDLMLVDAVSGYMALVLDCRAVTPGPPALSDGAYPPGCTPTVYYDNDADSPGYNPNEEHAFVSSGDDGYTVWALRCDLNERDSSPPVVLTQYRLADRWRMRASRVVVTNGTYSAFAGTGTVGQKVPGPRPFDIAWPNRWPKEIWWTLASTNRYGDTIYRDRNGRLWFRAAGTASVAMYYPVEKGFHFPSLGANQPAEGTAVPWLARLGDPSADVLEGRPAPWDWTSDWPTNNVPALRIGQTLTRNDGAQYPDVWNAATLGVVYPDPTAPRTTNVVMLTDPVAARKCKISRLEFEACGFAAGQGGNVIQRGAKWYFRDLPPSIADRVWYDTEAEVVNFVGQKDEDLDYLYLNVLTADEVRDLLALSSDARWLEVVSKLNCPPLVPNESHWVSGARDLKIEHTARDHYALTGMGEADWVVLVENDAGQEMVNETLAVKMHVLKTVREYFAGKVRVRADPNNIVGQRLSIMSTVGFAGQAGDYEFEWKTCEPNSDGTVPTNYDGQYMRKDLAAGRTSMQVGGEASTMKDLVNTYWICRYRARSGTRARELMGDAWSGWFEPPTLAEGWLQRCLNAITPFSQRMTDLYNNAAETTVSMIAQAGGPYRGDIALNNESIADSGLIQIYQTLLNTAESLSLALGSSNTSAAVNQQLLLATERLHDLYVVLGDEAYADAMNPTIGFGSSFSAAGDGLGIDYGAASSSLFCFDNQVRTLLDEEICLLRGRDGSEAPQTTEAPVYNRLMWNFTKGITAGEVAYAVNYDISGGKSAVMGAADAKSAFPQGHGDAYGHYLSALAGWYRLLRNPAFDWGTPHMGEMSVNGETVNVDYYEEAKFAEAAAKLASTAADVVDRTARKAWRDGGGRPEDGYTDGSEAAFGYGDWAVRGGYGALCNWVVGNAILPVTAVDAEGNPLTGLNRIDRGTVTELGELCDAADSITERLDMADAGLNPLGLSDDAVPFDIAPGGASDGTLTHYEQIRARAGTALANAQRTLDRAQEYSNRRRMIAETEDGYEATLAEMEEDFNDQLVAVFGRPYDADVGASGTYASGYTGPDLYHYMWMDLDQYGLSADDVLTVREFTLEPSRVDSYAENYRKYVSDYYGGAAGKLSYAFSKSGLVVKPAKTAGAKRPVNGEIQVAYGDFLAAYATAKAANESYAAAQESLVDRLEVYDHLVTRDYCKSVTSDKSATDYNNDIAKRNRLKNNAALTGSFLSTICSTVISWMTAQIAGDGMFAYAPTTLFEKTTRRVIASIAAGANIAQSAVTFGIQVNANNKIEADTIALNNLQAEISAVNAANDRKTEDYRLYLEIMEKIEAVRARSTEARTAFETMLAAAERLSGIIGRGNRLLEQRAAARQRAVSSIAKARYNDMLFRQLRNRTLSQYSTAFDLAQKYAFLAAKALDYETGLLKTDAGGQDFLSEIVATRSLGQLQDGVPVVADRGDGGLASALAKMDLDWELSLKGRLGINNPQPYATWFSLRRELFRIEDGDAGRAAWKTALEKCRVDDLRACPEFARRCQPFQSSGALAAKEPGLVIEFSSTIDFAKNFFGHELAACDSFFDTTYFCTKIANAGVWFEGYAQAKTPNVYLVPAGEDRMRAPGQDDGEYVAWNVVDQVIPVPYAIGGGGWSAHDWDTWLPSYANGDASNPDAAVKVRKYPSFRAYFGGASPNDAMLDCPRLVGRSVWNSRWLLVIPAGTLGGNGRDAALKAFIEGVSDIQIGFKTYSNSGN